ncbi:MAG: N-acetylmuramoyl-L-alanine amidase [Eubacteriales bacterium]|nr:N-acetylmuramoyl-L-alanine amidase [Eubacteriales bacterium]MDD4582807.1 N-acetylmuramoyl-L-alanine amidase [Eubacteriales bacterium]
MRGKWKWGFGVALSALIMVFVLYMVPIQLELLKEIQLRTDADVLLLDPGHGGFDGGAESAKGVCEKDINLAIAFQIKEMAEADGRKVIMTREEDMSLSSEKNRQSIRSRKTEDLQERKKMIRELKPLLVVSIHLNNFKQDRSVRGAQTFYPTGSGDPFIQKESKRLAEIIQSNLKAGLNDGTDRVALGKSDVMLFKDPVAPIVIVECGFLSNQEEEALLIQKAYQQKLAESIYQGILEYTGWEIRPPVKVIDTRDLMART